MFEQNRKPPQGKDLSSQLSIVKSMNIKLPTRAEHAVKCAYADSLSLSKMTEMSVKEYNFKLDKISRGGDTSG